MVNTNGAPSAEQIANQFEVQPLDSRLELLIPYGRDREQAYPDGCDEDCPLGDGC